MLEQDDNFTAKDLGLEGLNPYIMVNISDEKDDNDASTGNVTVYVTVQEDYAFHRDLDGEFFCEDGWLNDDAEAALDTVLTERYKADSVTMEEEYFEFDLVLILPASTDPKDLGNLIWEDTELVKFHNEVDPGTFGSQYLFGSLIRDALAATED